MEAILPIAARAGSITIVESRHRLSVCLAARDRGLGTVILGIFDRPALEEYLQVPPEQELMALIALGYPAQEPDPPRRKDVSVLLKTLE